MMAGPNVHYADYDLVAIGRRLAAGGVENYQAPVRYRLFIEQASNNTIGAMTKTGIVDGD